MPDSDAPGPPAVRIQPITPEDRAALVSGFERLGPESRYRRFLRNVADLTEQQLDYLTVVDHHDHEALAAFDETSGDLIGVARYVRTGDNEAEPAIAVVDDWQRRGVGGRLMSALADRAREEGISRFRAVMLADNPEAMALLGGLGDLTGQARGGEIEVEVSLTTPDRTAADLRAFLHTIADGSLRPIWDRVTAWVRRTDYEPGNAIVVGTEGFNGETAAVREARDLAAAFGASLHVVGAHGLFGAEELRESLDDLTRSLTSQGLDAHAHVRRGSPAGALLDVAVAQRARLIVVGSRGPVSGGRALLGSVSDSVAHHAPCHVLIVR